MAQGMQDIKRRIRSVQSTMKITKAMELVSSAKLKRSRDKLDETRPYFETIVASIQEILENTRGIKHPMLEKRDVKKVAYVVVTADRGLCGGYNSNVLKLVEKSVEEHMGKSNSQVLVVGQKGRDFFKRRGYDVINSYLHISEKPEFEDAVRISNEVVRLYSTGEVDEVYIAYTYFTSTISFDAQLKKVLPAESVKDEVIDKKVEDAMKDQVTYEPSAEAVLSCLIPKYIRSFIYGALLEASASEQAARRIAMENATDNAEDLIENLKLHYNRARQAAITQEIAEIVGGAEALS